MDATTSMGSLLIRGCPGHTSTATPTTLGGTMKTMTWKQRKIHDTCTTDGVTEISIPSGHYYLTDRPVDSLESVGRGPTDSLESVGGSVK